MTVMQLKAELTSRNLDASGKKAELVERLEQYEEENGKAPDADTPEQEENGEDEPMAEGDEEQQAEEEGGGEEAEADGEKMETEAAENGAEDEGEKKEKKDQGPDVTKIARGHCIALDDGTRIVIPPRDLIKIDLKQHARVKTVIVYPVKVEDIADCVFHEYLEKCMHFQLVFQENNHEKTKSENGFLELRFQSRDEAEEAEAQLSEIREGLKVKLCGPRDHTNAVVTELRGTDGQERQDRSDTALNRYVYIGNLPPTATEQALEALFPDAVRVAIIVNEDKVPKGYALAEFPTEESCERATKMYHNVAFEDNTLVVLKAWNKVPKGLLDDKTRTELLKNIRLLKGRVKGKSSWQYNLLQKRKAQNEMEMYKVRLDKDCNVRADLGLPVPPDVIHRENLKKEHEEKDAAEKEDGDEEKEGDDDKEEKKKVTPRKKTDKPFQKKNQRYTPSGPGRMRGGRGSWSAGARYGGESMRSYGSGDGGYGGGMGGGAGGGGGQGGYNQAMKMLMQVSHMLQGSGSQGGGGGGYGGGASSSYDSYSSSAGGYGTGSRGGYGSGSSYGGGYGTQSLLRGKRQADDGFGGLGGSSWGSASKMQRRW